MTERTIPSRKGEWGVAAACILLGALPLVFGVLRLTQLAGGAEVMPADARFSASPLPLVLHIVGATVYALLGALQFPAGFRRRWPGWHRAAGRLLVVCGLAVGLSGLWMTLFYPRKEGTGELLYALRLVFGSAMVVSIVLGVDAIRRRDVTRHRAWMARGYAIALGAGTQMLTLMVGELIMGPPTVLSGDLLMGAGWVINLAVAEWAIRRRPAPRARAAATTPTQRPRRIVVALTLGAVVGLFGVGARPSPPSLSTTVSGDAETADTKARALLPLSGARVDDVTLAGLASPRSGLPTQGMHGTAGTGPTA